MREYWARPKVTGISSKIREQSQMKDGAFVEEYADKISHLEKTVDGKYLVQAESKTGIKYTFKTSESDVNYSDTGSLTKTDSEAKG